MGCWQDASDFGIFQELDGFHYGQRLVLARPCIACGFDLLVFLRTVQIQPSWAKLGHTASSHDWLLRLSARPSRTEHLRLNPLLPGPGFAL